MLVRDQLISEIEMEARDSGNSLLEFAVTRHCWALQTKRLLSRLFAMVPAETMDYFRTHQLAGYLDSISSAVQKKTMTQCVTEILGTEHSDD